MDAWARWLLTDRFGGDRAALSSMLEKLAPIRDRVLEGAQLAPGDTLLDVGAGDGLIGFAALDSVGPDGSVVFSDVSPDLLDTCRNLATEIGVLPRCRFVQAAAEDLSGISDDSIDAVTTRSVLIYVEDKETAFGEFRRVLRHGGRVSVFEPLNSIVRRLNGTGSMLGYDTRAIPELAKKVGAVFAAAVGGESSAMLGFDAADLVEIATRTGFTNVEATVFVTERHESYLGPSDWVTFKGFKPNPLAPTAGEAIEEALSREEAELLRKHLDAQVRSGSGYHFTAGCFLVARAD